MTDTPPPNLVWETALDWLLLIQQNPDDPELNRRLNDWRASAPEHDAAWRKAQIVWQLSGAALSLPNPPAPAALADLPAPDAVFIGGTKGGMEAVVDTVLARNPNARICISAIALETLSAAVAALTAHGLAAEVTQIAVSRTRPAGRLHLLMANNPIFLITGERK